MREQLERLNRGLVAIKKDDGVFLSWRLFVDEVSGYSQTGLTGTDFFVYRNGQKIAMVCESTNYMDVDGDEKSKYSVAEISVDGEGARCPEVSVWNKDFIDIPMKKPQGGVTPAGEEYEYSANDMSVGDVDGDGEYEYIVKWDPSNSHDVSQRGYTGRQILDCYKLDGTILWRLDMGPNIRAGAHYTQFMVYDFNGDGKAEMAVKTAPGSKMSIFNEDGSIREEHYVSLTEKAKRDGATNEDNYVCSKEDYYEHVMSVFKNWHEQEEVIKKNWPESLEECFGIEKKYDYPLNDRDAKEITDYFFDVYAPSRSEKNKLREFEGFIYEGPEMLTMFAGDGTEIETIDFKVPRGDDGLMWGDYAFRRIEPCNRVARFLSGVAYLDGKRPSLIVCRGYYTRATIVAYDFFDNHFKERFFVDSGFVALSNPFNDEEAHGECGSDEVYGSLAGQGNHSLSTADVDGDGFMEIIYGAACIDHDGSLLYSSYGIRKDGARAKFGHGDAMHVGRFIPERKDLQIFNVFEGAKEVPYGFALRNAKDGSVIFGESADSDLGRCMVGKINKDVPGYQFWVNDVYDSEGNRLEDELPGTNMRIWFSPDLTTQITDGVDYINGKHTGIISDNIHGIMLTPQGTLTNNGTKGNPCLVADLFGDFREEIALRLTDSSAVRIYMNTDITKHKLFTLMHDSMYRCGIAWQNNCYNQPCYTKFYYGSDMDFEEVLLSIEK